MGVMETKIQLESQWNIFYERSTQNVTQGSLDQTTWTKSQNKVGAFETVAELWSFWNNLVPPSKLPVEGTYSVFRSYIQPCWEDENNLSGGEIRIFFNKVSPQVIDSAWTNLL